jgi:hypothetical protein
MPWASDLNPAGSRVCSQYLFLFHMGPWRDVLPTLWFQCVGVRGQLRYGSLGTGLVVFFFKIYLFYVYEYTVAVFRHTRKGIKSHYRWL